MIFDPLTPYNALPTLPPRAEIESKAILKACITARAALAQLKQAGELIPNQAVLINSIPLLEAQASSEIENIVTTTDRLFQFANEHALQADPSTKEALRYRTALYEGFRSLAQRPFSLATAVQVCRTIKGVELDIRRTPGTALMNDKNSTVIYTPPASEAVIRDKLANWERFLHESDEIDPLIRMAIGHYQFEAIHPFIDGNGRTGRVLNLLYLVDQGLLEIPVLYLSRAIIAAKETYYRLLLAVTTEQRWQEWILFMLDAVTQTAQWTTDFIKSIRSLIEETAILMRRDTPQIYSRELTELIFVQPYCRIANVVEAGIAQRQTASIYLKQLCNIGLLQATQAGREKIFINPAFLKLLIQR
ncbi:protein adenylyltransferase Fic [Mycoavidus sp. B2-EB]|uniref:protein adenylyltransferase Fic n=1 Tax=Mycoavidus sp. B2-EB TaxID=2651972 RepID=UPI001627F38C|nr:Fic family protein [Mycoavidus sp. B2-EB]BBO60411.1 adenosine monophosphate-protein transferase SoFic [Mycoavidus sp. B2-EB]